MKDIRIHFSGRGNCSRAIQAVLLVIAVCFSARADEGMWLFNAVPEERLSRDVGFVPSHVWLNHLQRSAVRFNSGGSGAFVSPNGLVLTNHHVAASSLQKLSTPERNLARDGFLLSRHYFPCPIHILRGRRGDCDPAASSPHRRWGPPQY